MKCDWCDSENIEQVGIEYNGTAIMHCKDCAHEFYGRMIDLDKKKEWNKKARRIVDELVEGLQDALEYEKANKEDPK